MSKLPWSERVVSFQINPESASMKDIERMATELIELTMSIAKDDHSKAKVEQ